jgi:putative nucleotidyltransferase with HDIG domain
MKAHEMIAKVRELPPVSAAALKLVSLLEDPEAGNDEAVQVLRQDPAMTAKLLRACNSPALALNEPVASVDQAVLLLGHKQICRMVVAMSLRAPLDMPLPAYAMEGSDLWQHSLMAATAAELAVMQGIDLEVDSSTAFTAGLLHDIGKLITSQFLTRQLLINMRHLVAEGRSPIEAEREVLTTDHAEVGAALAYMWRLPNPIVEAIGLHHTPPVRSTVRLSALAFCANQIAHWSSSFIKEGEAPEAGQDSQIFSVLGLSTDQLKELVQQVVNSSSETDDLVAVSC